MSAERKKEPKPLTNQIVLVVDDDPVVRTLHQRYLEIQGAKTFTAENGKTALEILKENPQITAVVTDFNMPIMGGWGLIKRIRKLEQERQIPGIPILLVCGGMGDHLDEEAESVGANSALCKPVSMDEITEKVKEITAKH